MAKAARKKKAVVERSLILDGDCFERMAEMDAESIDAIVTDPPYGIRFMGQAWDGEEIEGHVQRRLAAEKEGRQVSRPGTGPGERGKSAYMYAASSSGEYDFSSKGMIAFQDWTREWTTLALRALKPGGHLLSFSSARTYHRMVCGIEEAGFEIRDQLLWIYGSGFPKSLDVSKAIDKAAGAERPDRVVSDYIGNQVFAPENIVLNKGTPVTADAAAWDGWGTALKPAHEPLVLARKPLAGTVAENVLEHGTGALNVAAARVGATGGIKTVPGSRPKPSGATAFPGHAKEVERLDAGWWPANVLLTHLDDCKGTTAAHTDKLCAPGCPVAELNEASGETRSVRAEMPLPIAPAEARGEAHGDRDDVAATVRGHGDSGGAARFFYVAKTKRRERIAGVERNLHPTVKPVELMRWLIRLVTPPGGVVLDPFLGSGSTGCAAAAEHVRFIGVEREAEYLEIARARVADWLFAHPEP